MSTKTRRADGSPLIGKGMKVPGDAGGTPNQTSTEQLPTGFDPDVDPSRHQSRFKDAAGGANNAGASKGAAGKLQLPAEVPALAVRGGQILYAPPEVVFAWGNAYVSVPVKQLPGETKAAFETRKQGYDQTLSNLKGRHGDDAVPIYSSNLPAEVLKAFETGALHVTTVRLPGEDAATFEKRQAGNDARLSSLYESTGGRLAPGNGTPAELRKDPVPADVPVVLTSRFDSLTYHVAPEVADAFHRGDYSVVVRDVIGESFSDRRARQEAAEQQLSMLHEEAAKNAGWGR